MLKHKIRILFFRKISHVCLKSSNFKGVGTVNQFKSFYKVLKREREDPRKITGFKTPWLKRGSYILNFCFIRILKCNLGVWNTYREFQVQSPNCMYISLQIEQVAYSLQSYIHIYTHMHVIGDVLNCVDRSFKVSGEA